MKNILYTYAKDLIIYTISMTIALLIVNGFTSKDIKFSKQITPKVEMHKTDTINNKLN